MLRAVEGVCIAQAEASKHQQTCMGKKWLKEITGPGQLGRCSSNSAKLASFASSMARAMPSSRKPSGHRQALKSVMICAASPNPRWLSCVCRSCLKSCSQV